MREHPKNCSESYFLGTLLTNLSKTSVKSYKSHRNVKVFTATHPKKRVWFNLKTLWQKYIIIVQQNVCNTTTKMITG